MSSTFNFNAFLPQNRITDELIAALTALQSDRIAELERALAHAKDFSDDAKFLMGYGDHIYAADALRICRRNLNQALSLIDTIVRETEDGTAND